MATPTFSTDDVVTYTCPQCMDTERSPSSEFELIDEMIAAEAKQSDEILEVDLQTFMVINGLTDTSTTRVYACCDCGQQILYFTDSGCQYIS